ncbi:hypothetical protein [Nocardia sp. NPDC051832]|uniref:helix-turn-helix domain-containing protein n=1 Tax=Nocardia sp. NPDC051832 TaxID=3155673 RepID=UPI003417F29F
MAVKTAESPIENGGGLDGRIAGAVLAAIRRELRLGQEQSAARLGVALKTFQAWERGRIPITRLPYARLRQISRSLLAWGAAPDLLIAWETALTADDILAGLDQHTPNLHPLGMTVPDRTTTEMLTWPLTGATPRCLRGTSAVLSITTDQRAETAAHLQALAESAPDGERGAMLRRQTVFLVAEYDAVNADTGWAADQIRQATRTVDLGRWSPEWAVARSAAVRAASDGDLEPLQRFASNGLTTSETELANLRYWAYWVGECPTAWASDADMARPESDAWWSGEILLPSLLKGVVSAPYRELCAHSLWALARARRTLVTHPRWAAAISDTVEKATSGDGLSMQARQRLEQVHYLTGSMG